MSKAQMMNLKAGGIGTLLRLSILMVRADLFLNFSDPTVLASSDTEAYADQAIFLRTDFTLSPKETFLSRRSSN